MNNVEIILDYSYSLDGFQPSEVIALTFAEAQFNNLVTRGGTYSNRIKVGKTANNRQILGFPDENRETSSRPYTRFDCVIKVGGNPIFYGIAVLEQSQQFYELRIFSGLADFFKLLKDKSIKELDLSAQNHAWTASNVYAATNSSSNYCYPAINYGRWDGNLSSRAHTDFFPAIFFKYLLETSATEEGWTLNNYSEVYGIPFSKQDFNNELGVVYEVEQTIDKNMGTNAAFEPLDDLDTVNNDPTGHAFSYTSPSGFTGEGYNLRVGGTYNFRAEIDYTISLAGGGTASFVLAEFRQSDDGFIRTLGVQEEVTTGTTGSLVLLADSVERRSSATASYVSILVFATVGSTVQVDAGSKMFCTEGLEPIKSGETINLSDTLPDIKVKDLFLFEAVRKNALIVADPNSKTIEFINFDTIAGRWGAAKDWTDKLDLSIKPKYEYRLTEFARNNRLLWKEGSEAERFYRQNNDIGNYTLVVDDEGLEEEKTMYTAPFAASDILNDFVDTSKSPDQSQKHLTITRYTDSSLGFNEPDNNPVERVCKLQSSSNNLVQITLAPGSVTNQIQGTFDGWEDLVTANYSSFTSLLSRLKLVEVQVSLNAEDISNLDFTYPVKMLDNYWFLQEVRQWKANKNGTTTVKAIRL